MSSFISSMETAWGGMLSSFWDSLTGFFSGMSTSIIAGTYMLMEHPSIVFTLLAVLVAIFAWIKLKNTHLTTHMLIYMALMLALAVILHQIRLYHMPQGGSVTLGGMVPLLLISYRYGSGPGCLAGFIFGMITILQDPFLVHPLQVLFYYPLHFMALGLAAAFPAHMWISTCLAFLARFLCHFISGVVFFASYAPPDTSPYIYSLTINATYLIPEFVICIILLKLLPVKHLISFMKK